LAIKLFLLYTDFSLLRYIHIQYTKLEPYGQTFLGSGAGSSPQLGGTITYQGTFVWSETKFLWMTVKLGARTPLPPGSFTYAGVILMLITNISIKLKKQGPRHYYTRLTDQQIVQKQYH